MSEPAQTNEEHSERYRGLEAIFGFVPNLFGEQRTTPQAVLAEQSLLQSILQSDSRFPANERRLLIWAIASAWRREYCTGLFQPEVEPLAGLHPVVLKFALDLDSFGAQITQNDVDGLMREGLDDASVIEIVATVALGQFLCTLSLALGPEMDSAATVRFADLPEMAPRDYVEQAGPYLGFSTQEGDALKPSYSGLREQFGFVPNLFRIQSCCPRIVSAEVEMLDAVLFPEDHLSRRRKEQILLWLSSLNCNTYLVTMHTQVLSLLGVSAEECDQIVADIRFAHLGPEEKALLTELGKLSLTARRGHECFQRDSLRARGFNEAQIDEAIIMAALANFLTTVQFGLRPIPDFPPRRVLSPKHLYPSEENFRPNLRESPIDDPDSELVARVKEGESDAFEELVRRHSRRVFGTLYGILGHTEDARDSTQEVFLKAFQNIESFQGWSKFSTWLTSIAVNTGTELLRQRKPTESLNDSDDEEGFRPRQVQSWIDNPEQQIAKTQANELVRKGVLRLPEKYRVAVLLRDINQLSTEEAAAALNLSIPALKARVLRGRLMLRESLAPHFSRSKEESDV